MAAAAGMQGAAAGGGGGARTGWGWSWSPPRRALPLPFACVLPAGAAGRPTGSLGWAPAPGDGRWCWRSQPGSGRCARTLPPCCWVPRKRSPGCCTGHGRSVETTDRPGGSAGGRGPLPNDLHNERIAGTCECAAPVEGQGSCMGTSPLPAACEGLLHASGAPCSTPSLIPHLQKSPSRRCSLHRLHSPPAAAVARCPLPASPSPTIRHCTQPATRGRAPSESLARHLPKCR